MGAFALVFGVLLASFVFRMRGLVIALLPEVVFVSVAFTQNKGLLGYLVFSRSQSFIQWGLQLACLAESVKYRCLYIVLNCWIDLVCTQLEVAMRGGSGESG
jgi:hypothetical protein